MAPKHPETVAVLMPGDMGGGVALALAAHGQDVIGCLDGRSADTRARAEKAGMRDVGGLDAVVEQAGLILSILPPSEAPALARAAAEAITRTGARPVYVDCNAIAPATVRDIAGVIEGAGAPFVDAGIIGTKPTRTGADWGPGPRFYVSGADTAPMAALDGMGVEVIAIGDAPGRASALKMCYAGLTKGTFTLHAAVLLAAEAQGLTSELRREFEGSQAAALAQMEARVPRLPADAARWVGEMEEIARTFADVGVTPGFHEGAAAMFRLLAETRFATETRDTIDPDRTAAETIAEAARLLAKRRN